MASDNKGMAGPPPGDRKGDGARAARLKAALRENLRRRKSQAKGRSGLQPQAESGAAHDSAGFVQEIAPDKPKG
jgi:hypothetical protein